MSVLYDLQSGRYFSTSYRDFCRSCHRVVPRTSRSLGTCPHCEASDPTGENRRLLWKVGGYVALIVCVTLVHMFVLCS